MKTVAFAGVLAIFFTCGSASVWADAAPRTLTLQYLISIAGVETGHIALKVERDGDHYRMTSEINSRGLTDTLIGFRSKATTRGAMASDKLQPARHRADNQWRGDDRFVRITYDPSGPSDVSVDPQPENDDRQPVPLDLRTGTVDALSAAYIASLNGRNCHDTIKVFDGRRRYNILTRAAGHQQTSGPAYQGPAFLCELELRRIAGHSKSPWLPPSDEETGRIWFADLSADWPPIPVRFEIDILLGSVAVHLQSATARDLDLKVRVAGKPSSPPPAPVSVDK